MSHQQRSSRLSRDSYLKDNNNYIQSILLNYPVPSLHPPLEGDLRMHINSETEESEDNRGPLRKDEDEFTEDLYDDSGNEDEEDDLGVSEEIILPEGESEEEEEVGDALEDETDEEGRIFKRQMAYPPVPDYVPPEMWQLSNFPPPELTTTEPPTLSSESSPEEKEDNNKSSPQHATTGRRLSHPRERLGVLTPMEEVTEPPSSAGTEGSRRSHRSRRAAHHHKKHSESEEGHEDNSNSNGNSISGSQSASLPSDDKQTESSLSSPQKSILKSKSPSESPERRVQSVQFIGAGSITPSERTTSPAESLESSTSEYSSLAESGRKSEVQSGGNQVIPEETEEEEEEAEEDEEEEEEEDTLDEESGSPVKESLEAFTSNNEDLQEEEKPQEESEEPEKDEVIERLEKVATWQMGNIDLSAGNLEPDENHTMSTLDNEFPSILDDIISQLHCWDSVAGPDGDGLTEINASRQDHLANVSSQLASYLSQIAPQTVITNLPQIIPLVTTMLTLTEPNFRAQLTSLNTVNVFIDRLRDCKTHSGMKVLPNADLTWLIRSLCDISSESSRSVLRSEGIAAITRLVKVAGPEMILEPILFILTGNDEITKKRGKRREGIGDFVPAGVPGGAPKIKATALDTLTFALLTFPRDDFKLDVVAKMACHCLLHPKRLVRQASLECLAVISHSLGPNIALPMIRQFISEKEVELYVANNPQPEPAAAVNSSTTSISSTDTTTSNSSKSSSSSSAGSSSTGSSSSLTDSTGKSDLGPAVRLGQGSKIPVLVRSHQQGSQATGNQPEEVPATPQLPSSSIGPRESGVTPTSAVQARVSRHILPVPSSEELLEYGLKIPAKCQLLNRQAVRVGSQRSTKTETTRGSGSETVSSGTTMSSGSTMSSGATVSSRSTMSSSGTERLSSSGGSSSSISNIDYPGLLELEPVLNTKGSGSGQRKKGNSLSVCERGIPNPLAPDIAWILQGTGPVKKCDSANTLPKEPSITTSLGASQQWPTSLTNSSSSESELTTSARGKRSRPLDPKLIRGSSKNSSSEIHEDIKDSALGRYNYYPASTNSHMGSQRDTFSSRLSARSSFNLLPNKYSIMNKANNNQPSSPYGTPYVNGLGDYHHMTPTTSLLPGAYDHPYGPAGDSGGSWGNSQSDLGSLTRLKHKPLQPIHGIRDKFFDSTRTSTSYSSSTSLSNSNNAKVPNGSTSNISNSNSHHKADSLRSDSQQSESTEETESENDSESDEKTDDRHSGDKPVGKKSEHSSVRQSSTDDSPQHASKIIEKAQDQMDKQKDQLLRKGNELIASGMTREYQVYHNRIEVDPSANTAFVTSINKNKRGDVDSAGSSHTRDSGVSIGSSVPGNKTPPSTHTTPPAVHRTTEAVQNGRADSGQRHGKSRQPSVPSDLHRNWQSTPDVPLASDTDDMHSLREASLYRNSRRDSSGSPSHSDNRFQSNITATQSPSDLSMLLHKKPVLARRGQSVGRTPIKSSSDEQDPTDRLGGMPPLKYPSHTNVSSGQSRSSLRNGSGENHRRYNGSKNNSRYDLEQEDEPDRIVGYTFAADGSISPVHKSKSSSKPKSIRGAASTGNLNEDHDDYYRQQDRTKLSSKTKLKSKSSYLEADEDNEENYLSNGNGSSRSRVSRRDGPFGEVKAKAEEFRSSPTPPEHTPNTVPRRFTNGASKSINVKVAAPPKIFKGSFREINGRKASNVSTEVFPSDLKPVTSPKHALPQALAQLQSTDWDTNVDGFRQMVRLIRFNPETVRADLHNVNVVGIKHVANLRSQVCRAAILCFKELFNVMGKAMEADSEKIAEKLLDKASDTNRFIREDSGKALDAMMANLTPAKGITCLDLFGTRHRNPAVRCMAAKMTAKLVQTIGPDRCLAELPERLLPMLCRFLQEGSLETRKMAKEALSALMTEPSFNGLLKRHVPSDVLRHAQKGIDSLQKEIN